MIKRLIAAIIALATVVCLASCNNPTGPIDNTTSSSNKIVVPEIEETTLVSGVGKADENGVYVVPDGITFIREGAFANDTKLKEIVIPASVEKIGSGVFYGCTSLKKVTMTDNITSIGAEAFIGCESLATIKIPSKVTELLMSTFSFCSSLQNIEIPDGITKIESGCFMGCTSLNMVEFPASLSELGSLAFYGCTSLAVLDGLENTAIKSIGAQAFEGCTALQEISLPKNLETIGSDAFKSCTSLYDITIPKSVSSIGSFALSFTPWYQEKKDKFLIVGDDVLIKCTVNPYTCEVPGTLDLSDLNIKHIGNSCFIDAYSAEVATSNGYRFTFYLKNVILPEGLISIGDKAFYGCLNLESAKLPSTLTSIGNQAFFGYSGGEYSYLNINFDNCPNLKAIGSYAFYGCYNTEKVELPASVTYVGDSAFIETKAFYDFIDSSAKKNDGNHFYVTGDGVLLFAYVAKDVTDLIIPDGVKMISGGACTGWDSQYVFDDYENDPTVSEAIKSKHRLTYAIRKLVLPEGVNVIGENAFFRVGGIDNLVIPNTVTRIENSAFMLCKSLRVLKLSNKVEYIGNSCFAYSNLQAIELPDTLTYIGYSPFIECSLLKTIIIPASVKTFGSPVIDETMVGLESIYLQKENRKLLTSVVQLYSAKTIIYYYD